MRKTLTGPRAGRLALINIGRSQLPRCPNCKGRMRPDVVFFGESLPRHELSRAVQEARRCRLMLVLGTSGLVYPAASIPSMAKGAGAIIIEINPEPTAITRIADIFLPGPSGEVLPELKEAVLSLKGSS